MSVNTVVNIIPVVSSARSSLHYNAHQPIRTPLLLHVGAHLRLQTSSLRFEFCAIPALQEFFRAKATGSKEQLFGWAFILTGNPESGCLGLVLSQLACWGYIRSHFNCLLPKYMNILVKLKVGLFKMSKQRIKLILDTFNIYIVTILL